MQSYFDAKHLQKVVKWGSAKIFDAFFFTIGALFGQYWMLPKFSRLGRAVGVVRCSYRMQMSYNIQLIF